MTSGLQVENVAFLAGTNPIVDDVTVAARPGDVLAVVGPSGSGKTTLLRLIAGLEQPSRGRILFDDQDLAGVPAHRRNFGMMFQDFALFPHLTVEKNIAFGLRNSRFPHGEHARRVATLLDLVGLEGFGKRTIENLSGGERQRVALARSLAPEPRLLMLDEPLGSLDRTLREHLLVEMKAILARLNIPAVYVTHDQFEAFAIATSMAVMRAGRVVRTGTPQAIFASPDTEFVSRFLGLDNIIDASLTADGTVDSPCGRWRIEPGREGQVRLLLREEGVSVVEGGGADGVVTGYLVTRLFQGASVRITLSTAAGNLEFSLPAAVPLPADGSALALHVPHVQVIAASP